ncbi:MAG: PAS domain-containing protein [Candidatus Sericytochromatia bacterium]
MLSNDAFYSVLFANHPQPLWIFDAETWAFLDVNQAALDTYGYSREAFLQMSIRDIRPPEELERLQGYMQGLNPQTMPAHHSGPWLHQRQDGSLLEVKISAHDLVLKGRRAVLIVVQDITQEQAARRAESASQTRWQYAQENTGIGFWEWDLRRNRFQFSPQLLAMLGEDASLPVFRPRDWRELVHPEDVSLIEKSLISCLLGQTDHFEAAHRVRNGQAGFFWVQTRGKVLEKLPDGRPALILGAMVDIQPVKTLMERVEQERQRLLLAQSAAGLGVWEFDLSTRLIHWDPQMYALYGESPDTFHFTMEERRARVHPDDYFEFSEADLQAFLKGPQVFHYRIFWPDGSLHYLETHGRLLLDDEGRPERLIGVCSDITERKQAEAMAQALALKDARLQLAQSTSGVGVWDRDFETGEVVWDARLYDLMEVDPQESEIEAVGYLRIHPEDRGKLQGFRERMLASEEVVSEVIRAVLPEKGLRYHQIFGQALRDDTGRVLRLMGTTQDVTPHKMAEKHLESIGMALWESNRRLEHALAETRELAIKAELAAESKREFLNNMSHELRTPLHGVIGMSELLAQNGLNPDQLRMCEIIRHSGQSLLTLVNAVLDYSRLDHHDFVLRPEPFDLTALLGQMAEEMAMLAYDKGLDLAVEWRPGLALHYRGDVIRLRQMLYHLLHNALKFTERGEIRLVVYPLAEALTQQTLRFEVWDTGIGLDTSVQAGVFELFAQGNSSSTRRYGGTGMGLALVKRLVEHMEGDLGVEMLTQGGCCFWFEITLPADLVAFADDKPLRGRQVALVSETLLARHPLTPLLEYWGCHLRQLPSVGAACQAALPGEILVRDWPLNAAEPGLSACQNVPWLLLAYPEQFTAFQQLGLSSQLRWVPKPARPLELLQALQDLSTSSTEVLPPAPAPPVGPARILVVEDNPINQLLAETVLLKLGYAVSTAAHGGLALEALNREAFDLILMDCQMPEMDGYTATRLIRQGEGGQGHVRIPIVALTAHGQEEDRDKCMLAGMDDYMLKPFTGSQLDAMILRWLPAYRRALA